MILGLVILVAVAAARADVLTDDIICKIIHLVSAPFNKLRCDLSGDVPRGAVKSLTWSWKAKHVETKTCNMTSFVPELCELLLLNTSVSQVNCTISASNSRATCGVNYVAPTVKVNITFKPMPLKGGERVVFRCTAHGWPRPTITWFKDGAQIKGDDRLNEMRLITQKTVNKIKQVVDLEVLNVTKKHEGKYECIASNIAGQKGTEHWTFVTCPHSLFRCEIRRISPMVLILQKGKTVTLRCSVIVPVYSSYDPMWEPNINGYQETLTDEFYCDSTRMTRTIYNVSEVDTGIYTCSIVCVNEAEKLKIVKNSSIYVLLDSQQPFYHLLVGQETVSALPGSDVYLKCEVRSFKFLLKYVRTFWRFNGTTIKKADQRYQLTWHFESNKTIFFLKIRNVSPYDSGLYTCGMDESISAETLLENIALMVTMEPPQRNDGPKGNDSMLVKPRVLLPILVGCTGILGFSALVLYRIFQSGNTASSKFYSRQIKMEEFKSDVFVTYSSKDFEWVDKELIPVLEENHVNYIIHCRDFELGKPIVENMADSIYTSRKIIVILSRNYIASRFCLEELGMALQRNKVGIDTPIVVIRLEKLKQSEIPKDLRQLTFLDYADKEERQSWRERLTKELTA